MAKIRETNIEQDERVTNVGERLEKPRRSGGGFGIGALFGLVVAAGAVIYFAYSQGSFRNAGEEADRAASQVEQSIGQTAENAGDAAQDLGDKVEDATDTKN
jgi:hypothetical protein